MLDFVNRFNEQIGEIISSNVRGVLGMLIHGLMVLVIIGILGFIVYWIAQLILTSLVWLIPYLVVLAVVGCVAYLLSKVQDLYR